MAKNKTLYGIDISYAQTGMDYQKIKADGINFVIIRAGYTGVTSRKQYVDKMCAKHVNGCIEAGIPYGYYWYSGARTVNEAIAEAKFCADIIKKYDRPAYPVFFDCEEFIIDENHKATDICLAFVSEMEKLGYPSGVYTNPNWLENILDKNKIKKNADIWLAHWVEKTPYAYGQTMWQMGLKYSAGKMVDYDACFIDYPKKTAEWYSNFDKKALLRPIADIAKEVIKGLWGNGAVRKSKLTKAGYDYNAVQAEVNRILAQNNKK